MYRIELYETTGDSTVQTALYSPVVRVDSWSKRINAAGHLVFSLHRFDTKATEENLRHYRRVRLFRKNRDSTGEYEAVWFGYIEAVNQVDDRIEVFCTGMLDLFKKRYTGASEQFNGQGSTEAFGLLTDTNGNDGATGITAGTGGVTTTRDITLDHREILSAWEELARAHDAEFEIDDDGDFNFVPELGTDQSSVIELIFRRDGSPGNNVQEIEVGEDGRDMANQVVGVTGAGGGLTSTIDDATSQTTYGVLIERRTFNHANDQTTLDAITQSYVDQVAHPITDFRIVPEMARRSFDPVGGTLSLSGLDYGEVSIGDLITVDIVSDNRTISETKRIAEIVVDVDENMQETLRFTLSKSGVFVTATLLDRKEIQELKRKIKELEAQM